MSNTPKFHQKRTYAEGAVRVDTGIKRDEVRFRVHPANDRPFTLTYEEAYDLADALDAALSEQEDDPLT